MLRGVYFLQIPSFLIQRMQNLSQNYFSNFFFIIVSLLQKHAEKYMQCGENGAL